MLRFPSSAVGQHGNRQDAMRQIVCEEVQERDVLSVIDAKLTSGRSFNLTGSSLLTLLAVGLSLGSLILDGLGERALFAGVSMTLPLLICAVLSAALGYWVVPFLQTLKMGQIIREDRPQTHLQKAGTPTMGGVFFVPVAVMVALNLHLFCYFMD